MNYTFYFTQVSAYEIEADSLEEATKEAKRKFHNDMYKPIAVTSYDELSVQYEDKDGETIEELLW